MKKIKNKNIIWGLNRGHTVMSLLKLNYKIMNYVIDNNTSINGTYTSVLGNKVINLKQFKKLNFDPSIRLLTTNSIYLEEKREQCKMLDIKNKVDKLI